MFLLQHVMPCKNQNSVHFARGGMFNKNNFYKSVQICYVGRWFENFIRRSSLRNVFGGTNEHCEILNEGAGRMGVKWAQLNHTWPLNGHQAQCERQTRSPPYITNASSSRLHSISRNTKFHDVWKFLHLSVLVFCLQI